jgi:hypothetical protein
MIAVSPDSDPRATQDPATGAFVFKDVPPGKYALAIWTPVGDTIIQKPGSDEYLLVEVKAGEITDLGTVLVP